MQAWLSTPLRMRPTTVGRGIWYAYLIAYLVALVAGLQGLLIAPFLMAIPLTVATALFAVLYGRRWPRLLAWAVAGTLVQLILGSLLLGGPGTTLQIGDHVWIAPPGLPLSIEVPALLFGLLLPPTIAVTIIRSLERHAEA